MANLRCPSETRRFSDVHKAAPIWTTMLKRSRHAFNYVGAAVDCAGDATHYLGFYLPETLRFSER